MFLLVALVRLGLTVTLFWWAWRTTSTPVLVILALLTLRAEGGALLHLRHTQEIEALTEGVKDLAQATTRAVTGVAARQETMTRSALVGVRRGRAH